jgi:signal transduction histidine kinase
MNEIVKQIALNLDTLIQETEARLVFERLPPVLGHKNLLVQLLQNLLSNALKFSRPDRRLVISVASSRLSADSVQFTIQDNGIGIPPAQADTVFEAFTRLHAEDAFQGSGLGLAICKKIVGYYGGSIWIESEEGNGTRVFFTLPAAT